MAENRALADQNETSFRTVHSAVIFFRVLAPAIFLLLALFYRDMLLDATESIFGGLDFMTRIIAIVSTVQERLILFIALVSTLSFATWVSIRMFTGSSVWAVQFALVTAIVTFSMLPFRGQSSIGLGICAGALIFANSVADTNFFVKGSRPGRYVSRLLFISVGVAEALVPRLYWLWISTNLGLTKAKSSAYGLRHLPGIVIASAIVVLNVPFPTLAQLGQKLFLSPQANVVFGPNFGFHSPNDISFMALDPENTVLFMCGNGSENLLKLNRVTGIVDDTGISTGHSQFCAVDSENRVVFFVNKDSEDFVLVDVDSLQIRNSSNLSPLPVGEIFVNFNKGSNVYVAASEALERQNGLPSVHILDAETLITRANIEVDPGFMTTHPSRPVMYVNYFFRDSGVQAYDLNTGDLLANAQSDGRSDRTLVDSSRDELLVTSPVHSRIQVFDAKTLMRKRDIPTIFGARGLAIDSQRDLLLVSSLLTNQVDVIDLATNQSIRRYRLGPWLRDIVVDVDSATAYVSSRYGVYSLSYIE